MSTRERLAAIPKVQSAEIGGLGTVYVRLLPANRRQAIADLADKPDSLERIVQVALVEENGTEVYAEGELEEIGQQPLGVLNQIVEAFNDLNGWSSNGRAALGKGLPSTPSELSPLSSANNSESGT